MLAHKNVILLFFVSLFATVGVLFLSDTVMRTRENFSTVSLADNSKNFNQKEYINELRKNQRANIHKMVVKNFTQNFPKGLFSKYEIEEIAQGYVQLFYKPRVTLTKEQLDYLAKANLLHTVDKY